MLLSTASGAPEPVPKASHATIAGTPTAALASAQRGTGASHVGHDDWSSGGCGAAGGAVGDVRVRSLSIGYGESTSRAALPRRIAGSCHFRHAACIFSSRKLTLGSHEHAGRVRAALSATAAGARCTRAVFGRCHCRLRAASTTQRTVVQDLYMLRVDVHFA